MANSQTSKNNAANPESSYEVLDVLDDIIREKRRQDKEDVNADITDDERKRLLRRYHQLERIKNERQGKFLMEYRNGLETLVQEFVV